MNNHPTHDICDMEDPIPGMRTIRAIFLALLVLMCLGLLALSWTTPGRLEQALTLLTAALGVLTFGVGLATMAAMGDAAAWRATAGRRARLARMDD